MKAIGRQVSDHWREDFRCYASQWGFRCGSEIAKLIDFIRDEHRAKYGVDYRLRRLGKNRFIAVPGDHSDSGVSYAVESAQKFNTSVTCGPNAEHEPRAVASRAQCSCSASGYDPECKWEGHHHA